jgi:hypothetical protein
VGGDWDNSSRKDKVIAEPCRDLNRNCWDFVKQTNPKEFSWSAGALESCAERRHLAAAEAASLAKVLNTLISLDVVVEAVVIVDESRKPIEVL